MEREIAKRERGIGMNATETAKQAGRMKAGRKEGRKGGKRKAGRGKEDGARRKGE